MALSDDITTRIGTARLVELTNFDDAAATTVNTTRLSAAITDAQAAIRRRAGLIAPVDTTTVEYDSYRELVLLGTDFYLQFYRSRQSDETDRAKKNFEDSLDDARRHASFVISSDAVVDTAGEDDVDRDARFAPSHFDGFRIG